MRPEKPGIEDLLRELIRDEVCAQLVAHGARSQEPKLFTTRGPFPAGRTAGWFRRAVRTMPGARRSGGRRGRGVVWTISREDYDRWLSASSTKIGESTGAMPPQPDPSPSNIIDVDRWIADHRRTRRGGK